MNIRCVISILVTGFFMAACQKTPDTQAPSATLAKQQVKYPGKLIVYKQASCGCCTAWASYMRRNGFDVEIIEERSMNVIRNRFGVADNLKSCHTAVYGNLVIEGHVPVEDVASIIATPSLQVRLIAVPGMPIGSPGMESGDQKEPYASMIQDKRGKIEKFREHGK
jgi:hypothetical protein